MVDKIKSIVALRILELSFGLSGICRSSPPEVFYKNGVLRNLAKFTGKRLYQGLFFNKVAKKRPWYRCFPVNIVKFLRTPF